LIDTNAKMYLGADIDSLSLVVLTIVYLKLKKVTKAKIQQLWNPEELKDIIILQNTNWSGDKLK